MVTLFDRLSIEIQLFYKSKRPYDHTTLPERRRRVLRYDHVFVIVNNTTRSEYELFRSFFARPAGRTWTWNWKFFQPFVCQLVQNESYIRQTTSKKRNNSTAYVTERFKCDFLCRGGIFSISALERECVTFFQAMKF